MAWKVYSWIFAVMLMAAHIFLLVEKITLLKIIDVPISLVALVGLFGYAYKKKYIKQGFWQIFLFILIGWDMLLEYLRGNLSFTSTSDVVAMFLFCLITFPEYIAIYKYSFTNRIQWDQNLPSNNGVVSEAANDTAPHTP